MSVIKYLLIAAMFALLATEVRAGSLEHWQSAGWYMGAYSDDSSGQFTHCGMSANYQSGVMLLFSVDRAFNWRMSLNSPSWSLAPGAQYDIAYQVDGGPSGIAKAVAITPQQVVIELRPTSALFRQFQNGRLLTILTGGQTLYFQLKGTRVALAEVLDCAERHVTQTSVSMPSTNPFVPSPPSGNLNTTSSEAYHAEAATLVANMLSQAGITGFQLVSAANVPPELKGVDAAWVAPGLLGTVNVLGDAKLSAQDVQAFVMARDAQSCKGKFASGATPSNQSPGSAIRLFTVCDSGGTPIPINYTIAKRPGGGAYILAVAGIPTAKGNDDGQATESARRANESIRDASYRVLGN